MTGYRQQKPRIGLTKCPDLVDHYSAATGFYANKAWWQISKKADYLCPFERLVHGDRVFHQWELTFDTLALQMGLVAQIGELSVISVI